MEATAVEKMTFPSFTRGYSGFYWFCQPPVGI